MTEQPDVAWTSDEKQDINDMLGRARYKERMKQMRNQRAGKARMVAKKDALVQDESVATKLYASDDMAPTKAKLRRAKHNKQAKVASAAAKKTVFETGNGNEKVTFHLDEETASHLDEKTTSAK